MCLCECEGERALVCVCVLPRLLTLLSHSRLICPAFSRLTAREIKSHSFFSSIDWPNLSSSDPPFTPTVCCCVGVCVCVCDVICVSVQCVCVRAFCTLSECVARGLVRMSPGVCVCMCLSMYVQMFFVVCAHACVRERSSRSSTPRLILLTSPHDSLLSLVLYHHL